MGFLIFCYSFFLFFCFLYVNIGHLWIINFELCSSGDNFFLSSHLWLFYVVSGVVCEPIRVQCAHRTSHTENVAHGTDWLRSYGNLMFDGYEYVVINMNMKNMLWTNKSCSVLRSQRAEWISRPTCSHHYSYLFFFFSLFQFVFCWTLKNDWFAYRANEFRISQRHISIRVK